ncbi:nonribosomal peptide synthase [Aspergillus costaricaensis CBS 115574]|uniref:Nonribosomal peptide synthase n=1 Tax=Aspergillus costaricaensis CBS 115574 TaxID=1448317 RepID=A0ACD1I655_9EURO|nr:nonribosomal peptide synthase [Aspergillus costaricaensis CBS 115574]RAK85239.1 nonribosomal peptide synthase [Aspergillus costaricaensis CBS 115574]
MVGKVKIAPCQFPSLSPSPSPQKGRNGDTVHTIDILQGDDSISQWGPDLGPRLRVIWAIILSVFVHDDSVVMGYEECADSRDSAYLLQHCSSVYATTIDREDDLTALVGSGRLLETDSHDPRVHNTGVLLLDGGNRCDLAPKNGSSPTDAERCDLIFGANRDPAGLRLFVRFRTAYISETMAGHIADAIQEILSSVRHNWQGKVKDLNLLSRASHDQILSWNTQSLEVSHECLPDLIDRASSKYPDAIACCTINEQITYRELQHLSTALSAHLLSAGVRPHTYVGLILDKTIWSVVIMLAVLRTGAACMPLDSALLPTQASSMLREANTSVILTTTSSFKLEPHWVAMAPQMLEITGHLIQQLPKKTLPAPPGHISPTQPAFLMYTSGSTGAPKGVVQPHQDIVTCVQQMAQALQLHSSTRFLQFAAFSFDLSCVETLCTLSRGGCVCIPGNDDRLHRLAETGTALCINTAFLTAAVLAQVHPDEMLTLKTLTVGGDVLTAEQVALWAPRVDHLNVSYGTTEGIMFDTLHADLTSLSDPRNIGRSFGPRAWIVDPADHNKLLPIGAVGELVVQGGRLSQGYLEKPEKTAAVFIDAPAWAPAPTTTTSRCYKTGDLARYLPDGSIYLLGRKDRQVKLRGQRVELDDLEARLKHAVDLPRGMVVADVIVLPDQTKQLVGFVYDDRLTKRSAADAAAGALFGLPAADFQALMRTMVQKLKQSLSWLFIPTFMFPLLYVPKTRTGKIDRTRLRQAAAGLAQQDRLVYAVPLNEGAVGEDDALVKGEYSEKVDLVCKWYAESLGVGLALVLPKSNFFHLGGDSIKAMRITRLAKDYGYDVTFRDIFNHPQPGRLVANVLVTGSGTDGEMMTTATATAVP